MITDKGASAEPTLQLTGPQVVFSEYNVLQGPRQLGLVV